MRRELVAMAASLAACAALAQLPPADPDWIESDAPPPPALKTDKLVPLAIPRSDLRFGIDPASVSIGKDGIVRYVVVATSNSGATNAMYEGIRCDKGEYRTYARHTPGKGWTQVNGDWRSVQDGAAARHALAMARTGACMANAPNISPEQVVKDLVAGPEWRLRPEVR
jgi:hypothetical protein